MKELIRSGFEIKNGRVYGRGESVYKYELKEVNTFGGPQEYRIYDSGWNMYTVKQDSYDDWYLYSSGHSQLCKLYYHGGNRWTSY